MLLNKTKKLIFLLSVLIIIGGFFIGTKNILAQEGSFGFEYATQLQLGTRDLRAIIISIINIFLGFLGIIVIIVMMYGGFVYMTSAGDPNKIEKAKKILINGAVGLGIILSSWAIVMLIFRMFGIGGRGTPEGAGRITVGPGALGSGIIQSHYPERNQHDVPRNTMIVVTFKEAIDPATIINDTSGNGIFGDCLPGPACDTLFDAAAPIGEPDSIKIFKNIDGESGFLPALDVTAFTNDNKTFVFMLVNPLGSSTEEFWYTVRLKDTIKKAGGENAFSGAIGGTGYQWQFEVSTIIDITPPQIKSIIPYPDDTQDSYGSTSSAQATGSIIVDSQPNTYIAPGISAVIITAGPTDATVNGSYAGDINNSITVTINGGAVDANVNWSATTANNNPTAPIISNSVSLGSGLTLIIDPGYAAGNQWTFNVTAEVQADFLRVDSTNYRFVTSGASGNEIDLGANVNATATNIANKISGQSVIETPVVAGNLISITSATAGSSGNSIALIYNSPEGAAALTIVPMAGGTDSGQSQSINGKRDEPRNIVVQINFNEAVSPITTTGEVTINGGGTVGPTLDAASFNMILPSIDLSGTQNYIAGNWIISNGYRTVEFITKDMCGVNSCGQDVFCLPTNPLIEPILGLTLGNILIEAKAAQGTDLPTADFPFDGIIDMAANSLDGNKDGTAIGPSDYYDENTDTGLGDSYLWSFWINSKVDLIPPVIEEIVPTIGGVVGVSDPIEVKFSKLMMSSSLKPDSGYEDGRAHLTLVDTSVNPAGYWINSQNIDENMPPDDAPDKTKAFINHTTFTSSTNYRAQAGEGLKDLYQNCYMPAADTSSCAGATATNRSCCNGILTAADDCP
jgi:hypothetical protein